MAQLAPVWLDREATLEKIIRFVADAADKKCRLVVFGEAVLPGYPFWLDTTGGAAFDSPMQKAIHAHYVEQAVQIEAGHLDALCSAASEHAISIYVGCVERPADRGGHSLYCSLVYIDANGEIGSVHRKLMPTYEERLTWSPGDGHGLRVHPLGPFTVGGLNCWENWMPLTRTALYGLGEDLHVAVWPGSVRNTGDITRFIAREGRSFVISASSLLRASDISPAVPHADAIADRSPSVITDGGSCIASPDGSWVVEPVVGEEKLIVAEIDHRRVLEERQNFDAVGHYSRPDVLSLSVDRQRQAAVRFVEEASDETAGELDEETTPDA